MFSSLMEIKGSTLVISLTLYFLEYMGLNRFLLFSWRSVNLHNLQ